MANLGWLGARMDVSILILSRILSMSKMKMFIFFK